MLFTSYAFPVFLMVTVCLYYTLPIRFQWKILLGASWFFYLCLGFESFLLLLTITTITYFGGRVLAQKVHQKQYMLIIALACLAGLAYFKYANFVLLNWNQLQMLWGGKQSLSYMNLLLPMGISFYTFQALGYLFDVYRGKQEAERNFLRIALFLSFFPQMVQGPISRYGQIRETLYQEHRINEKNITFGLQRILWGFFKKLVLADRLLPAVIMLRDNPEQYQGIYVLFLMVFYGLELYADFTGGIDITIGIAEVFGVKLTENFVRPYFAKSVQEYWRRWHISMGTWFADYLFYPLSVSKPILKCSKWCKKHFGKQAGRKIPVYLCSLVVWLATGVWHGAGWNFIVWGLCNWIVIVFSAECAPVYAWIYRKTELNKKSWYPLFQIIRTFLLMSAIRLFDCYREVGLTFRMLGTLFLEFSLTPLKEGGIWELGLTLPMYLVLGCGFALVCWVSMLERKEEVRIRLWKTSFATRWMLNAMLLLVILVLGVYGSGYDATQFIYNQF